jgi:hypothetical protein
MLLVLKICLQFVSKSHFSGSYNGIGIAITLLPRFLKLYFLLRMYISRLYFVFYGFFYSSLDVYNKILTLVS